MYVFNVYTIVRKQWNMVKFIFTDLFYNIYPFWLIP